MTLRSRLARLVGRPSPPAPSPLAPSPPAGLDEFGVDQLSTEVGRIVASAVMSTSKPTAETTKKEKAA